MGKIALFILVMAMLMVTTAFALEHPWEKDKGAETQEKKLRSPVPAEAKPLNKLNTKTFNNPLSKGYRLDWCLNWAVNC